MRVLRYVALLFIAIGAFAAEKPLIKGELARDANGNFQFQTNPSNPAQRDFGSPSTQPFGKFIAPAKDPVNTGTAREALRDRFEPDNTDCYRIRSYIMRHDNGNDAMHLDRVTTCTPKTRVRMKTTVRFLPVDR